MALKLSTKQIIIILSIIALTVSIVTAVALYNFLLPKQIETTSTTPTVTPVTVSNDALGSISASKLLNSVQKTIPTISDAYSFNTTRDPSSKLNTPRGYVAGIAFYDTRTGAKPTGAYGSDAGGVIEVYRNIQDATNRANQLSTQQNSTKTPVQNTTQVDRYIITVSPKLDRKSQISLASALSTLTMQQLSSLNTKATESQATGN